VKTLSINKGKDNNMARIVGVDIPRNKKIIFSLCYIHGIGTATAFGSTTFFFFFCLLSAKILPQLIIK